MAQAWRSIAPKTISMELLFAQKQSQQESGITGQVTPMSASASDMCDLFRAEMALEHAWKAFDRARHSLPVKSKDTALAQRAQQVALECSYLGNLAFTYECSVHDLMMERQT